MTFISLGVLALTFIAMLVSIGMSQKDYLGYGQREPERVYIKGQYSVDGGEWKATLPGEMVHERFHTVTIKGVLDGELDSMRQLVIFGENIYFVLKTDGVQIVNEPDSNSSASYAISSPGITLYQTPMVVFLGEEPSEQVFELTLTYPYTMFSNADLSDFFQLYVTDSSGVYDLFFKRHLLTVLFCIMICFFGLFAFPIAGSVIGGINYRYWAFSVLCFFAGLHLLMQNIAAYLPLWISDPFVCMSITETTSHLLGICLLVFIKVILVDERHKLIGNLILLTFSALIIGLFVLNATGVRDLYASNPFAQSVFTVCAAILTVCLFRELKSNRDAKLAIITLIPLAITLMFDTLNMYLGFSNIMLFEIGVAVTLVIQIVNLLYDLRQQYKERIRVQQMQRELYESRVAIMVSQIQPHFLYNSLSSIAMMCTIDPETAQEATVTFADYLRGNMDSLKQKTPVPFSKELEHLKKYLYIEKLRFGKKLNIVYDVQTEDFVLPQLSIQPLAENAVKHGISKKRGGGTLTIATREEMDCYKVIVSDDGKGFDVNEVKNDGRSHIGMDNVRRRLKEMCGGEVIIESKIDEGTVATVILPKEGQQYENPVR